MNRAIELDPSLGTTKTDTIIQEVITPGVRKDSLIYSKEYDTVKIYKDKLRIKYVNLPGDTAYIDGECAPDTITVYSTRTNTVYKIPPTYRAFIQNLLGINKFQFWLLHSLLVFGLVVGIFLKFFR